MYMPPPPSAAPRFPMKRHARTWVVEPARQMMPPPPAPVVLFWNRQASNVDAAEFSHAPGPDEEPTWPAFPRNEQLRYTHAPPWLNAPAPMPPTLPCSVQSVNVAVESAV